LKEYSSSADNSSGRRSWVYKLELEARGRCCEFREVVGRVSKV